MDSQILAGTPTSGAPQRDGAHPEIPNIPGPPSIISSRMTDIASDDGADDPDPIKHVANPAAPTSDIASRPPSTLTGVSSLREGTLGVAFRSTTAPSPPPAAHPKSPRKNYPSGISTKRGSSGAGSISGSVGRSPSFKKPRSHVPSLTSHAFFHPLSSQKLQAQRSGQTRSLALQQPPAEDHTAVATEMPAEGDRAGTASPAAVSRQSATSNPNSITRVPRNLSDDGEPHPPPSPGTEATERETLDRLTANTSPTHGHRPAGSLSESVRPLQKPQDESRNLTVDIAKTYKERGGIPSPLKSPRSFRSSFLLPNKTEQAQTASNRSMPGAEKLPSVASSPRMPSMHSQVPDQRRHSVKKDKRLSRSSPTGKVFEYFEGNTVFFLGGRFQNSRQRPINLATLLGIVAPTVIFFVFSASWLWHNISPAIPVTLAYLVYICFSSFIHASVSDPGVSIHLPGFTSNITSSAISC